MRSLKTFFLSAAAVLLVITASANADRQLIDLGPGVAYSINNNGQIVGSSSSSSSGYATLFDSTGGKANTNIAPIISGTRRISAAYSINNNGQIVGYADCLTSWPGSSASYAGSATSYAVSAFLFDSTGNGHGTNLGALAPQWPYSTARAINENGCIVGSATTASGAGRAARFRPSPVIDLGTLGGPYSQTYAINDNDKIVGSAWFDPHSIQHACIFDSTGHGPNIDLDPESISDFSVSVAYSINNFDQIVGYASYDPMYSSAVLFDSTGQGANIDLGALPSYLESVARSINDHNQIVGYASFFGDSRAVLFDSTGHGKNIDLNTLVAHPSWALTHAYGINNNGWIVGDMTNTGGETHAFLLTPEPATVLLFALGGISILRKHRM